MVITLETKYIGGIVVSSMSSLPGPEDYKELLSMHINRLGYTIGVPITPEDFAFVNWHYYCEDKSYQMQREFRKPHLEYVDRDGKHCADRYVITKEITYGHDEFNRRHEAFFEHLEYTCGRV